MDSDGDAPLGDFGGWRSPYGVDMPDEELLHGGNASGAVVRVGGTVRKPWLPTSARVVRLLRALREHGLDVPEPRGRDDQGRLVLAFVPGRLAMEGAPLDLDLVARVGALVRSFHDATAGLPVSSGWPVLMPAPDPNLICHNDLAPWNLVLDGDRLVFIDWDGAGPSTRLWDLAYAALSFGHLFPDAVVSECAARLAAFADGYAADGRLRDALPAAMTARAAAMRDLLRDSHDTGREPWATMYASGHGSHWRETTRFIAEHEHDWRRALGPS